MLFFFLYFFLSILSLSYTNWSREKPYGMLYKSHVKTQIVYDLL
jgi:hypothetical protein